MLVVCKVACPYNERGFCSRGLTPIGINGVCEVVGGRGASELQQRPLFTEEIRVLNVQAAPKKEEKLEQDDPKTVNAGGMSEPDSGTDGTTTAGSSEDGDAVRGGSEAEETGISTDGSN